MQAVHLGASDFLEKPFTPEDVRLSVASVLEEARECPPPIEGDYAAVLESVRGALRAGALPAAAERLLMRAGTITGGDPAFYNLAGILHEARGRIGSARRFYERALVRDPRYEPAEENRNRLEDISRNGRTIRGVNFGEDEIVTGAALR